MTRATGLRYATSSWAARSWATGALFAALPAVLALTGCHSQSRAEGMRALCDTWSVCESCQSAEPSARAVVMWSWVQEHVTNAEALAALTSTTQLPMPERAAAMRAAAAADGITRCGLADEMAGW